MSVAVSPEQLWLDDPIVKHVIDKRDRAGGYDALDILSELSDTLNTLEDKFPGVPFGQIFTLHETVKPGSNAVRRQLEVCNVPEEAISIICPRSQPVQRTGGYMKVREMALSGKGAKQLRAEGASRTQAYRAVRLRGPLRDIEAAVGGHSVDHPHETVESVAKRFGVSPSMVSEYSNKVRFHRERGTA